MSFMGRGTLCHMGMPPLCPDQKKGVRTNPAVHIVSTCYGVVNLNLFHPKLLCEPPLRVSGRWVGGS